MSIVVTVDVRLLLPPAADPSGLQVDIGGEAMDGSSSFAEGDVVGEPTISIAGTERIDQVSQLFSMGG